MIRRCRRDGSQQFKVALVSRRPAPRFEPRDGRLELRDTRAERFELAIAHRCSPEARPARCVGAGETNGRATLNFA